MEYELGPCRPEDLGELVGLANRIFRAGRAGDMGAEYPLVFEGQNVENLRVARLGDRLVSHVGICVRDATLLGARLSRVDGQLKVTGRAKYAAEFEVPNVLHAVAVGSTIAKGTVTELDLSAARSAPMLDAPHTSMPFSSASRISLCQIAAIRSK